jgi:membrane protein DedA with SNARE-associated domain
LTSQKNRLVYTLAVIGLLTWLVAFIRMAYLSGPNWLVNDLGVIGAVLLLLAVIFAWVWKDSKD